MDLARRSAAEPSVAAVVRGATAGDAPGQLATALDQVGLWVALDAAVRRVGTSADRLRIVVLVAISPPAPVSARLLEELVDLLQDRHFSAVTVGTALSVFDRDRGYTEVEQLVDAADYRSATRRGLRYEVVDLPQELVRAEVPDASVLSGHLVPRRWAEAEFRIVVSRNVTDPVDGYALCLDSLARAAPAVPGADPADVVTDLLAHLPPHLAIVDASMSSHGQHGSRVLDPLETAAVLAGTDALLVDVLGAALQGVDPAASRPVARALTRLGLPPAPRIEGDFTPFVGWRPAHPLLREAAQRVGRSPGLARVLALAGAPAVNRGGEVPDVVTDLLRTVVAPLVEQAQDPTARAWLGWLQYAAAAAVTQGRAWKTVLAKDSVDRVEVPLGFDLGAYTEADYRGVPIYLALLDRLLDATEPSAGGMRWRYLDGSVLFEVSRVLEAPYEEFVARVDIAEGISLMADYLGGRAVPVGWDDTGRVVMQAERNVYLPQPNYLGFWDGEPIDVCKIELVEYTERRRRLMWRTVASPNGSADHDDGSLTFASTDDGRTVVVVRGRQRFTLPPFWAAVDLDRFPEIKDALVEDAYRRFFTATFDNLEACYEGREFRIGRQPADPHGPLPTAAVGALLELARGWLAEKPVGKRTPGRRPATVDQDGFRHFTGGSSPTDVSDGRAPWWQRFADDLVRAAETDWSRVSGQ